MRERYVLLGLAPARAEWFHLVGRWSNAAVLPAEFVRCVSVQELRTRLRSGRPFSAVLIDAGTVGLDRDLIADAAEVGAAVLVVADPSQRRDWRSLGAAAVLAPAFSRDELLEVLAATARTVGEAAVDDGVDTGPGHGPDGRLVAVTGPGGTGASTAAAALAQGLVATASSATSLLLADLCLDADQAMLHDTRAVVPGVQELAEAHRTAIPAPAVVLEQTFEVPDRGYRLLLGLRRHRHWTALRPRAVTAMLDSLQRVADVVVADVDADTEGEAETGSPEVEDRNLLARTVLSRADVVLVVGEPSAKGLHALTRTIVELLAFGVPPERVLPVLMYAPRSPRVRAELTRTVAELLRGAVGAAGAGVAGPLFLPTRRGLGTVLRDGAPLPTGLARPLARAVDAVLERVEARPVAGQEPVPVVPGSLGGLAEPDDVP